MTEHPPNRIFSALDPWLDRKAALPDPSIIEAIVPDGELGGSIVLERSAQLHEAGNLRAQSLNASWSATRAYLSDALEIIGADTPMWIDREEAEMIREQLGDPPPCCLPLYFISVGAATNERLVYVGRTSSSVSRFRSGHAAITQLHSPEYEGMSKQIYLASVTLLAKDARLEENGGYLPLEWISPLLQAEGILSSIENAVIYDRQPELNRNLRRVYRPIFDVSMLHVQNSCEGSNFLNETFISPGPKRRRRRAR